MGVDAKLTLPPNVAVDRVAKLVAQLLNRPDPHHLAVEPVPHCATLARIVVYGTDPAVWGEHAKVLFYHFECPTPGHRAVHCRATAPNLAVLHRLATFFGGSVDNNDCDDTTTDLVVPPKPDHEVNPTDEQNWDRLKQKIQSTSPITPKEIQSLHHLAAYP